jgi:hypothetical protein
MPPSSLPPSPLLWRSSGSATCARSLAAVIITGCDCVHGVAPCARRQTADCLWLSRSAEMFWHRARSSSSGRPARRSTACGIGYRLLVGSAARRLVRYQEVHDGSSGISPKAFTCRVPGEAAAGHLAGLARAVGAAHLLARWLRRWVAPAHAPSRGCPRNVTRASLAVQAPDVLCYPRCPGGHGGRAQDRHRKLLSRLRPARVLAGRLRMRSDWEGPAVGGPGEPIRPPPRWRRRSRPEGAAGGVGNGRDRRLHGGRRRRRRSPAAR